MSWFGGGLSSITSQISTFTKEVLTETTEEIQDPTAELHVARRRVAELDDLNKKLQSEWERLNRRNEEVVERADTAELQIATISQEYRKIIQEKDNELRRLKNENETLKEEQRRLLSRDSYHHGVPSEEFLFTSGDDLNNNQDIQDVSDMIRSQGEINRLQAELATVRMECLHWKAVVQERPDNTEDSVPQLKRRIEELQSSLLQETERSQQELSALQFLHTNRLQSLAQRHREEVVQLQDQLNAAGLKQKQEMREEEEDEDVSELRRELETLRSQEPAPKETVQDLKIRSDELCRQCESLESIKVVLESQLAKEKASSLQLQAEVVDLKHQLTEEKSALIGILEHEKQLLVDRLAAMQAGVLDQEASTARLQSDHHQLQQEAESLQQMTRKLAQELKEKEEEIATLRRDGGVAHLLGSTTSCAITPGNKGAGSPGNKGAGDPSNTELHPWQQPPAPDTVTPASLCEDLEGTIKSLRQAIQVERAQRERLTAHIVQLTSDHDHELSLLLEEKESLLGEVCSIREDLDRTGVWREQTLTESTALKMENVGLKGEVARLEGEVTRLEVEVVRLEGEVVRLEGEVVRLEGEVEAVSEAERRGVASSVHVSGEVDKAWGLVNQRRHPNDTEMGVAMPGQEELGQLYPANVVWEGEKSRHEAMEELLQERDKEIVDLRRQVQKWVGRHSTKEAPVGEAILLGSELRGICCEDGMSGGGRGSDCAPQDDTEETQEMQSKGVRKKRDEGPCLEADDLLVSQLERSQLLSDLQVQREALRVCEGKLEARQQECTRHLRELERLKPHLIELQDQFAQEALRYQREEGEMRRYVKALEDQFKSAGAAEVVYSQQLQMQLRNVEQQVCALTGQRDDALSRLARASEEAEQSAKAVSNLQSVLELFQREQASEVNTSVMQLQRRLAEVQKERDARGLELQATKTELQRMTLAIGNSLELKEEVAMREASIAQLQARVKSLQACLDETQGQLAKLSRDSNTKLDRSLVKNMVVQCTQAANQRKRQEVLQLIAKILEVPPEELDPNLGKSSGWLTGLWSKPLPPLSTPSTPAVEGRSSSQPSSLSQLFVNFLESESSRQKGLAPTVPSPGYVDPKTDPDRPSRATAATLTRSPPSHVFFAPPPAGFMNQTISPPVSNVPCLEPSLWYPYSGCKGQFGRATLHVSQ
ncbi:hypothetical protein EMCRGX_G032117 [Ephydatia muelleri]